MWQWQNTVQWQSLYNDHAEKKQDINKVESSGEFRLVTQKVAGEF